MNQLSKFRDAINELARRWCNVDGAFSDEQAATMFEHLTHHGEDADTITAQFCAYAYGLENLSVKDAKRVVDSRLLSGIKSVANTLPPERSKDSAILDILCRHWADFSEEEKTIIADTAIRVKAERGD